MGSTPEIEVGSSAVASRHRENVDPAALAAVVADLEQQHSRLNAIVTAAPVGLIELDLTGRVRMWNAGAVQLYGYTADEVVGRRVPTVRDDEEAFTQWLIDETLAGRPLRHHDAVRWRKDGSSVDVAISTAVVFDQDDRPVSVLKATVDMTRFRLLERQARSSMRMDLLGRLAGGLAHDFNNLLTVILNHAQFIADDATPGSSVQQDAERVSEAAERAARLTRQLLSLGRPRDDRGTAAVELGQMVRTVAPLLEATLGRGVHLVLDVADDPASVMVERGYLEQAISNLVLNARDAMPRGGRVTVSTAVVPCPRGRASGVSAARCARLMVRDTGVGMDSATLSRVFEPFYTTKEDGAGTGLGLTVVHDVVQAGGGSIEVESEPGRGATFSLYFPLATAVAEPAALAARAVPSTGNETVLLVASANGVRDLALRTLSGLGYVVVLAESAGEALAWLHDPAHEPSVLLTELFLPAAHGAALARSVAALRPNTRVLVITGRPVGELARYGLRPDPESVIEKPFTPQRLAARVREALDRPAREITARG